MALGKLGVRSPKDPTPHNDKSDTETGAAPSPRWRRDASVTRVCVCGCGAEAAHSECGVGGRTGRKTAEKPTFGRNAVWGVSVCEVTKQHFGSLWVTVSPSLWCSHTENRRNGGVTAHTEGQREEDNGLPHSPLRFPADTHFTHMRTTCKTQHTNTQTHTSRTQSPVSDCFLERWRESIVGVVSKKCLPPALPPYLRFFAALDNMRLCGVILAFLSAALAVCGVCGDVPPAERSALVDLYRATNGQAWETDTNWLTDLSVCQWFGVVCDPNWTNVQML